MNSNEFISKLEHFTRLSAADREAATRLWQQNVRRYGAKDDVIREGDRPVCINLIVDGWACRYKYLADGRRQIVSLFLPGDLCDIHIFVLREMDHFIGALTPLLVAQIPFDVFQELTLGHPRLLQALWWESLVTTAVQREWTVNLGQRTAFERIAHLIAEIFVRLRVVGRVQQDRCEWPITQTALADATGLSTVHVSRTMQALRDAGLVVFDGRQLIVPDLEALMAAGLFQDQYLHLGREGRHLDAND